MNRNDLLELCRTNPPAVADLVLQLQATVTAQQEQIVTLTARVAALEARLKTDSHNSSKPPSSDPPAHKPHSLRKPSGRKPGGQAGHSGRTLTLSDAPDVVVTHTPAHCADCHADLRATSASGVERRQVLDVPPLTLIVTEHQSERKVCPHCGHVTQAAFPEAVSQPVQYGPQVQALGVYLLTYQLLPLKRASELLGDVFSTTFCAATLYAAQQRAAALLQPAYAQIAHAVQQAPVAHFDESGLRVNGKLHWLHVAGTAGFTHYRVQAKRGQTGMNQAGILPHFAGTAVHDGWASYFVYGCRHALCNAHHLRELTAVYEAAPQEQAWALGMQTLLRDGKHAVEAAQQQGATCLPEETLSDLTARYATLVQQGYATNPPPAPQPHTKGRPKQSKARNLLDRLHTYQAETVRFLHDFAVPFDNNLAERDVRMLKVQQKISGGFRTQSGSEAFCCAQLSQYAAQAGQAPLDSITARLCRAGALSPA
jgi:transposase